MCQELVWLDREGLTMWRGKQSQHGNLGGSLDRDQHLSPEETLHITLALSHSIDIHDVFVIGDSINIVVVT